jgi:hypothetical protein
MYLHNPDLVAFFATANITTVNFYFCRTKNKSVSRMSVCIELETTHSASEVFTSANVNGADCSVAYCIQKNHGLKRLLTFTESLQNTG